jgi:hypothetical protein
MRIQSGYRVTLTVYFLVEHVDAGRTLPSRNSRWRRAVRVHEGDLVARSRLVDGLDGVAAADDRRALALGDGLGDREGLPWPWP